MKIRVVLMVALVAAVSAACGGKQAKAPAAPVAAEPETGGGGQGYGGDEPVDVVGSAEKEMTAEQEAEAIAEVEAIANEICKCPDQACVQTVMTDAETRMKKWEGYKPSAEGEMKLQEIVAQMGECLQKIVGAGEPSEEK